MLEIKNIKARVFSVTKDSVRVGRIVSDGAFGCEPGLPAVVYLSPDELDQLVYEARKIGRESKELSRVHYPSRP